MWVRAPATVPATLSHSRARTVTGAGATTITLKPELTVTITKPRVKRYMCWRPNRCRPNKRDSELQIKKNPGPFRDQDSSRLV